MIENSSRIYSVLQTIRFNFNLITVVRTDFLHPSYSKPTIDSLAANRHFCFYLRRNFVMELLERQDISKNFFSLLLIHFKKSIYRIISKVLFKTLILKHSQKLFLQNRMTKLSRTGFVWSLCVCVMNILFIGTLVMLFSLKNCRCLLETMHRIRISYVFGCRQSFSVPLFFLVISFISNDFDNLQSDK